jgi:hypothetical protein
MPGCEVQRRGVVQADGAALAGVAAERGELVDEGHGGTNLRAMGEGVRGGAHSRWRVFTVRVFKMKRQKRGRRPSIRFKTGAEQTHDQVAQRVIARKSAICAILSCAFGGRNPRPRLQCAPAMPR